MNTCLEAERALVEESKRANSLPRLLLCLALALALLAYIGVLRSQFVYDDIGQIVENPRIQSWHSLPQYFNHDVWSHVSTHPSNYYRPVFLAWLLLNYKLFGANPVGWHAAALLVHLAVTGLIYLLSARELLDREAAAFAAILFALHPIHVEAVAWVSGITEPLMALLFIGSLLCFLKSREQHPKIWFIFSLLLFALAVLEKETAIVLPLFIFIFGWRSPSGSNTGVKFRAAVVTCIPYALVAMAYLLVRLIVLHGFAPSPGNNATAFTVIATWPAILWFYLEKLLWPWPLSLFYNLPFTTKLGVSNFVVPVAILLAVGCGLGVWSKRVRGVGLASALMFVPLLPAVVATVRLERGELVHDRYLYLPSIGFVMLCALGLRRLRSHGRFLFRLPALQAVLLLMLICALGTATAAQSAYWASNWVLFAHAVRVSPQSTPAKAHMANELANRGQMQAALELYKLGVAEDPDDWSAQFAFGFTEYELHNWPEAEKHLLKTAELRPDSPIPLTILARVERSEGKLEQAERSFRQAIALSPVPPSVHYGLGELLQQEGRLAEAREEFKAELTVDPNSEAQQKIDDLDRQLGAKKK